MCGWEPFRVQERAEVERGVLEAEGGRRSVGVGVRVPCVARF